MPDVIYQVRLHAETNLPEDDAVNVLCFFTDDIETVADGIAAAYTSITSWINGYYNGMTVRAYPFGGGQPLFSKDYAVNFSGSNAPTEVALCLSYATVDDVDTSTPRRRGRIYLPIPGTSVRPSTSQQEAALDLGEELAAIGVGTAQTWKLWSRTDGATFDIESIWVDDAWDTQRRRGLAPTARIVRDVQ